MKKYNYILLVVLLLFTTTSALIANVPVQEKKFKRIIDQNCNGEYTSYHIRGDAAAGTEHIIRCPCAPPDECGTCPEFPTFVVLDQIDQNTFNQLTVIAETAIANSQTSGQNTVNVSVVGETMIRSYKISWLINAQNQIELSYSRLDLPPLSHQ